MQRLMVGLDRFLRRRRALVLVLWVAALLAAAPFAAQQSRNLTGGGFEAPGSPSHQVEQRIAGEFPEAAPAPLLAVLAPRPGAGPDDLRGALRTVEEAVARVGGVEMAAVDPREAQAVAQGWPERPAVVPLVVRGGEMEAIDVARALRAELGITPDEPGAAAGGRVAVHLAGQGALWAALQEVTEHDVRQAEARAFPIVGLVLLSVFGSLAAAALPLSLGVGAVVVTGALIFALSNLIEMSVFVTSMASMIGIGVAVDYSLFVLARYREEVRAGRTVEEAREKALATSGVAVLFSGLTVITSLAGLFLLDTPALRSMAIGAIIVVSVSLLAVATLLPALIGLMGRRAYEPGRLARMFGRRHRPRHAAPRDGFWVRWTNTVMRRPAVSLLAALAVLLTLALPVLDMQIGNSALRQFDPSSEVRQGVETAAAAVGPGMLGPVQVLVEFRGGAAQDPDNRQTVQDVVAALGGHHLVARVLPPRPSEDGRSVLLTTVLDSDPESQAARDAVVDLREALPPVAGRRAGVEIGGTTAVIIDFDDLVWSSMWKILLFILSLSFVALLVLLRSIALPIKAVLMNLLSVGAAYGVMVAVFQWGWLEFLGLERAPFIDTITPPLVLAIAFGLSMDYEIFLLSRIRERFAVTGDTRRAVAEGLASSARTITSAAVILVAVFLAFVSAGLPAVQRLGLATAVAIAVDATIVRLVVAPAAMGLLSEWNWWLPKPLARILPAPKEFGKLAVDTGGAA